MFTQKQIVFPRLKGKGCYVEARITRVTDESTDFDFELAAIDTIRLDSNVRVLLDVGGVEMEYSDSEGVMSGNAVELQLADTKRYGYTSNDIQSDVVCPAGESFLTHAFAEEIDGSPVISYVLWLSLISPDGSTTETYFTGDAVPATVLFLQQMVHMPHTEDEDQLHNLKLAFTAGSERMKKKTIKDIEWSSEDFISGNRAWFLGVQNINIDGGATTNWDLTNDHHDNLFTLNYRDIAPNLKAIMLKRIVKRLSDTAHIDFNEADPIESPFTFYHTMWGASTKWEPVAIPSYEVGNICVNWNVIFGVDPSTGSTIETPATWKRDMTLSNALKLICNFTGTHAILSVDQTTKRMTLKLKNRRALTGTMPTRWRLKRGSKEELKKVAKNLVEVSNLGFTTKVCVPTDQGDSVKIEIPFGLKKFGGEFDTASITNAHMTWLRDRGMVDQPDMATFYDESKSDNTISSSGWIAGSLAYFFLGDGLAFSRYPGWMDNLNMSEANFNGLYALSYVDTGELNALGTNAEQHRFNSLYTHAQFYARECLGKGRVVSREYHGCLDDSGSLIGITLGMESTFRYRSIVRDWRAIYLFIDPLRNAARARWEEQPADGVYADQTYKFVDGETQKATVNSGGGSASTSQIPASDEAVSVAPKTPLRNSIKPQSPDVAAIILDAHATQSVSIFEVRDGSDTNLTIDKSGRLTIDRKATGDIFIVQYDGDPCFVVEDDSAEFGVKVTSPSTVGGDIPETLTTKDYVDDGDAATLVAANVYADAAVAAIDLSSVVSTSRTVSTTAPLSGGGDLSANRTISLSTNANNTLSISGGLGINLANANNWSGAQTLPVNSTQGNALIASVNGGSNTIDEARLNLSNVVVINPSASQTITLSNTAHSLGITPASGAGAAHRSFRLNNSAGTEVSGGDGFGRLVTKSTFISTLDADVAGHQITLHSGQTNNAISVFNSSSSLLFGVLANGTVQAKGLRMNVTTTSTDITLDSSHFFLRVNATTAARTVNLPAVATSSGQYYIIKRIAGANNVTIDPSGAEVIDGGATYVLSGAQTWVHIMCNGASWDIVAT